MNDRTARFIEQALAEAPEPEPAPIIAAEHCGDTCGEPGCHYGCDPVTCVTAAFDIAAEAWADMYRDDDYCDTCGGDCTL